MFPVVWALPRWGRKVNRWLLIVVYLFVFCLVAGCLIVAAAQWGRKVNRWILIFFCRWFSDPVGRHQMQKLNCFLYV